MTRRGRVITASVDVAWGRTGEAWAVDADAGSARGVRDAGSAADADALEGADGMNSSRGR